MVVQGLAAGFTQEHRDWHAPNALARDAPVRAGLNHVGEPFFAPRRIPFHFFDSFERARAQRVFFRLTARHRRFHRDEPLLGGPEDHRIMAAPAVRIRVLRLFRMQQRSPPLHQVDDRSIGVPHSLAVVLRQSVAHNALFVHVAGGVEAILHAGGEILRAVGRCGVNHSRPGVHGDVVREHSQNFALQERMLKVKPLQLPTGEVR